MRRVTSDDPPKGSITADVEHDAHDAHDATDQREAEKPRSTQRTSKQEEHDKVALAATEEERGRKEAALARIKQLNVDNLMAMLQHRIAVLYFHYYNHKWLLLNYNVKL